MIKFFTTAAFMLFSLISIAQEKFDPFTQKPEATLFYLDAALIDISQTYFDKNEIRNIEIKKSENTDGADKVFITTSKLIGSQLLGYKQIENLYAPHLQKPALFLINGNIVKQLFLLKIDASYIFRAEVNTGADYEALKNLYNGYTIINLVTRAKENADLSTLLSKR